ncbi:MAG TPA: PEP-CTERM sorting domain-containing protein [Candidatus Paceibacterota bacterium]|nr:PEP-CTERM sorting domain-containing protein [Verrucomicrobiota bacterium]HSA10064.1 PEP-CTERM sorting domain-containing protein [Candidatus Paceibacterota bacterium]
MRTQLLILGAVVLCTLSTHAGFIYSDRDGTIPDGNPAGWSATVDVSGLGTSITPGSISVNLNISGGYNGDLYAYLSYGGVLLPLLNRVGVHTGDAFGYGDTGFNVTLSDSGANNVHFYGNYSPSFNGSGQLTGTWDPDGRTISPLSTPDKFDAAGTVTFANFESLNPNGTWTIFFADLSSGEESTLVSWDLNINGVPEPVNVALGIFAGVFLTVGLARNRQVRTRIHQWRTAVVQWIDAV